jgi:negative regulator of flagellin synthesis FlgM
MSIEIPGKPASSLFAGLSNPAQNEQKDGPKNTQQSGLSSYDDKVNVTPMANKLNDLVRKISAEPIVDDHRINTIKYDIEHGSYVVNPSRVAEKFFRFELALHR